MDFLETPTITNKRHVHPRMAYVRKRISENVKTAITYYRDYFHYIPSNHVIIRLCKVLLKNFDILSYYSYDKTLLKMQLADFAEDHAKMLGIGTTFKTGTIQSWFYKRDYLYISNSFQPRYETHWSGLQAIKVMSHGRNDLSYGLVTPTDDISENKVSAIEIDLHALLYMLVEYFHPDNEDIDGSVKNMERFVSHYVFPNMLPSHIDVAWYNRISSILIGKPLLPLKPISGLTLPGNGPYLDLVAEYYSLELLNQNVSFGEASVLIEGMFNETAFDFYRLKDIEPTNSGYVWTMLSRGSFLALLLEISSNGKEKNLRYVSQLAKFLRMVTSMGLFNRLNTLKDEEEYFNSELIAPVNNEYGYRLRYI